MSIKGLFRVLSSKHENSIEPLRVCGTAFVVARDNIDLTHYYLLTAFHVISEIWSKGQKIFLQNLDYGKQPLVANLVWSPPTDEGYEFGGDFALLDIKVGSNTDFEVFPLKLYSKDDNSIKIWGTSLYAPTGSYSEFFKISVSSHSLENIIQYASESRIEHNKSLVMTLNFPGNVSTNGLDSKGNLYAVTPHEIFGGFSGAPVLSVNNGVETCIGSISNIAKDTIASKVYGVVSDTFFAKCDILRNLLRSIETEKETFEKTPIRNLGYQFDLLMVSIFENPHEFVLDDPNAESKIWDQISNLFYKGYPVDTIINFGVYSEQFCSYSIDTQLILHYFLARLYFKRGKPTEAYRQFKLIRDNERKMSRTIWNRINILMESRSLIESPISVPHHGLDKMLRTEERLSQLTTVNDIYKANELASVLGRGLTNMFGQKYDFSTTECRQIQEIVIKHTNLLLIYPDELRKQDVVNISISWLINIWNINSSIDLERFFFDIDKGFRQAEVRKNSIFHIQSLLAFSVYKFISRNYYDGVVILFLVVRLMRQEQLDVNHEGISQLLTFIKTNFLNYYGIFNIAVNHCNDGRSLHEKLNLYKDNLFDKDIVDARLLSKYIKDTLYGNSKELYTIKLINITNLF
jgi:hypothetical protein